MAPTTNDTQVCAPSSEIVLAMIPADEFVENSVTHQLGNIAALEFSYEPDVCQKITRACSNMALAWNSEICQPHSLNGWKDAKESGGKLWELGDNNPKSSIKTTQTLQELRQAGADFDFLIDMQDRRARQMITPDAQTVPVFTFNRPVDRKTGHILWPLPKYHSLNGPEFLGDMDPIRIPWAKKRDKIAWRGEGGGGNRGRLGPDADSHPIRVRPLLRRYKSGEMSLEETERVFMSMTRFNLLTHFIKDDRFDIGFTSSDGSNWQEEPFIGPLHRPRINRPDFQTYKYLLVLPGSDVGSSFFWSMNSGSACLVVDGGFECFGTHLFKPWKHYVPILVDKDDVEQKLKWCSSHQDECREMARKAAEVCQLLGRTDLRLHIQQEMINRLRRVLPKANSGHTAIWSPDAERLV